MIQHRKSQAYTKDERRWLELIKFIDYYVEGHTSKGYLNLLQSNLKGIHQIFLLENCSSFLATDIFHAVIQKFKSMTIERIRSIEKSSIMEGIIIRELGLAILNERIYEGDKEKTNRINLRKNSSIPMRENHEERFQEAYEYFQEGLKIHEQLEKIYIDRMNFHQADRIIGNLQERLFADINHKKHPSVIYERFFGTNTAEGIKNTLANLVTPIAHKIFIVGRAGTGKSYLMNQILKKGISLGIDFEVYRCSLDPDSIDMLIVRELNLCIHDNTSPHVIDWVDDAEVIDMYKLTVKAGTDELFQQEIESLEKNYQDKMKKALHCLSERTVYDEEGEIKASELQSIVNHIIKSI